MLKCLLAPVPECSKVSGRVKVPQMCPTLTVTADTVAFWGAWHCSASNDWRSWSPPPSHQGLSPEITEKDSDRFLFCCCCSQCPRRRHPLRKLQIVTCSDNFCVGLAAIQLLSRQMLCCFGIPFSSDHWTWRYRKGTSQKKVQLISYTLQFLM